MVKTVILILIISILFLIENRKIKHGNKPSNYTKTLYKLHIFCGILFTLFATVHGIGNLRLASTVALITGLIILLLLYVEIIIGMILYQKQTTSKKILQNAHKIIPILLFISIIFHMVVNKLI